MSTPMYSHALCSQHPPGIFILLNIFFLISHLWLPLSVVSLTVSALDYSPEMEGTPGDRISRQEDNMLLIYISILEYTGFSSGCWGEMTHTFYLNWYTPLPRSCRHTLNLGQTFCCRPYIRTMGEGRACLVPCPIVLTLTAQPLDPLLQDSRMYRSWNTPPCGTEQLLDSQTF